MKTSAAKITHGKTTGINCIVAMHLMALCSDADRDGAVHEIIETTSIAMGNNMAPGEVLQLVETMQTALVELGDQLGEELVSKSADASLHDKCFVLNTAAAFATRRGRLGRPAQETIAKIALWMMMSESDFMTWRLQFEELVRVQHGKKGLVVVEDLYA